MCHMLAWKRECDLAKAKCQVGNDGCWLGCDESNPANAISKPGCVTCWLGNGNAIWQKPNARLETTDAGLDVTNPIQQTPYPSLDVSHAGLETGMRSGKSQMPGWKRRMLAWM